MHGLRPFWALLGSLWGAGQVRQVATGGNELTGHPSGAEPPATADPEALFSGCPGAQGHGISTKTQPQTLIMRETRSKFCLGAIRLASIRAGNVGVRCGQATFASLQTCPSVCCLDPQLRGTHWQQRMSKPPTQLVESQPQAAISREWTKADMPHPAALQ